MKIPWSFTGISLFAAIGLFAAMAVIPARAQAACPDGCPIEILPCCCPSPCPVIDKAELGQDNIQSGLEKNILSVYRKVSDLWSEIRETLGEAEAKPSSSGTPAQGSETAGLVDPGPTAPSEIEANGDPEDYRREADRVLMSPTSDDTAGYAETAAIRLDVGQETAVSAYAYALNGQSLVPGAGIEMQPLLDEMAKSETERQDMAVNSRLRAALLDVLTANLQLRAARQELKSFQALATQPIGKSPPPIAAAAMPGSSSFSDAAFQQSDALYRLETVATRAMYLHNAQVLFNRLMAAKAALLKTVEQYEPIRAKLDQDTEHLSQALIELVDYYHNGAWKTAPLHQKPQNSDRSLGPSNPKPRKPLPPAKTKDEVKAIAQELGEDIVASLRRLDLTSWADSWKKAAAARRAAKTTVVQYIDPYLVECEMSEAQPGKPAKPKDPRCTTHGQWVAALAAWLDADKAERWWRPFRDEAILRMAKLDQIMLELKRRYAVDFAENGSQAPLRQLFAEADELSATLRDLPKIETMRRDNALNLLLAIKNDPGATTPVKPFR